MLDKVLLGKTVYYLRVPTECTKNSGVKCGLLGN